MAISPKVSVIIPVYNVEKYLHQCLDSIINQTFKNIEIICVDDGSTDSSAKILEEYAQKYSFIKVLHQQNLYAGVARNNGLKIASGEYVFFLDGDDFCAPDLLSLAVNKGDSLGADIVVFDHIRFDEQTGTKEKKEDISSGLLPKNITTFSYKDIPNRIMSVINPVPWNKLIRRDFILKNDLHFEALSSTNDITFSALCAVCASKIAYIKKPLVFYRVNISASITSTKKYKLDNVITALLQTYKHAKALSFYSDISASVQYFVISNLYYALTHYAGQPDSEIYQKFYQKIGTLFGSHPLFFDVSKEKLSNNTLWEFFTTTLSSAENAFDRSFFPKVIVSLTSYPKRINTVSQTIQTMLEQTEQPDEIILWLASSEFPNLENDLPADLLQLLSEKVKIKWTKNLKSYKKLIPALIEYPDDIIITIDDDLLFDKHIIERLLNGYRKQPHCIQCHRITALEYHGIDDIELTPDALKVYPVPTYLHKLSGGAGCLYPPHSLHPDVLREDLFMSLAPTSDDIWFWLMGALNGYKVNVVDNNIPKLKYIPGTQEEALWKINDKGEKLFFTHLKNILYYYPILMDVLADEQILVGSYGSSRIFSKNREKSVEATVYSDQDIQKLESQIRILKQQNKWLQQEIASIHQSWSYRSGRFITWIPRMVRGFLRCYREHGFSYTFERVLVHLKLKSEDTSYVSSIISTSTASQAASQENPVQTPTSKSAPIKRDYDYYRNLSPEKYEEELKLWFVRTVKYPLNLENPKTFDEKLQWLKLYDSTPLKTRLADKYLVREWVKEKIGAQYLIPLLGVWDKFDDIDFDKLPNSFVLKANHGCGWNIIVRDKSKFDIEDARKKFAVWMNMNFAFKFGLELQYLNIPPKIIAEEYMENGNNDLYDYKVFCFNGKADSIMFLSERQKGLKMAFYDLNWNKLPFTYSFPRNEDDIPKPKNLELLIQLSEKLAEGFAHVRVDFYILNDGSLKFGEMTFTSASGSCKWNPPEQDRIYGDLIKLPQKSPIPERKVF